MKPQVMIDGFLRDKLDLHIRPSEAAAMLYDLLDSLIEKIPPSDREPATVFLTIKDGKLLSNVRHSGLPCIVRVINTDLKPTDPDYIDAEHRFKC